MRDRRGADTAGFALVDTLVGLAVLGIVVAAAVPGWSGWRDRQRLRRAVWRLELDLERLRVAAARDGRIRALLLENDPDLCWSVVVDGDGDGVRMLDVQAGRDTVRGTRTCLAQLGGGMRAGVGAGGPSRGPNGTMIPADGLALSGALLSVSPTGGGSSGTLYLSGRGSEVVALRRYGPTGRVTTWRYESEAGWRPL